MGRFSHFSDEQKDQLLESLETFYDSPKVGTKVKELIEEHFGVTDPSLAMTRQHSAETQKLQERIDTLEAATREKEIRSRVDSEKTAAQEKFNLTDDEMKEVSKMMVESGIGNYEKAADYYRLSKQAAVPRSEQYHERTSLSLPGDIELFKDRNKWARQEAYKALGEIERNRV